MSQAVVGALRVSLGLDSAQFTTGLTAAQRNLKQVGDRMKAVGATIATAGVGMAVAAGAAFIKLGFDALKAADDIGDAAARLGVTAEAFQKLEIAATSAGAAPGLMTEAMDKLNVGLGAFMQTGGGPAAEAFKQLGLSGQIASGQIATADQAFYAAAKALESISNPAEKARLSAQLFGRAAGADMLEVLAPGEAALRGYGDAAAQSGRIMSTEMVEKLSAAKLTIDTTSQAFMQMAQVMVGDLIVGSMGYLDTLKPMIEQGKALAAQIGAFLGPSFAELAASVRSLMAGPFGQALGATLRFLAQVIGTTAVVAIKLFVEYLNIVAVTLDGTARNVAGFVDNFLRGFRFLSTEVPAFIQKMVDGVARWLTGKLFDVLKGVIEKVKFVSDAFFRLYDAVVGNSYVPDMVEGIAHWMAKLDAGMVQPAIGATNATKAAFETLRNDVASILEELLTDTERANRELARKMATLNKGLAEELINPVEYAAAVAALNAQTLEPVEPMAPLGSLAMLPNDAGLIGGMRATQQAFDDAANDFADTFAQAMGRVLDGDIKGLFNELLRDVMNDALRNFGRSLFSSMGGGQSGGSGGSIWATLGRAAVNAFAGGGGKAPGFKTGGSFRVGGYGGADSQLMQFRATPGEMVDIRRPGQDQGNGGMAVHVVPSPYFDVRVEKLAAPIAGRSSMQAFGAARSQVPADAARRARFNLGPA
jgi:hypothetical protein